jgi:hypothetical protein
MPFCAPLGIDLLPHPPGLFIFPFAYAQFAFKSACTHLGLQSTQWRLESHDRLDVSNASMQLQRFERREIERPTRDPRTGAVVMRRVMTEVPVVVDHRLDTATALRLHLRRTASSGQSDSASPSAADSLLVEVGVSLDANRIMSLTRVTAAPGQSLSGPTSAGAAAPRTPGQLRVLSFNIWNFNFWWYRKELALKEITMAQADVRFSVDLHCVIICFAQVAFAHHQLAGIMLLSFRRWSASKRSALRASLASSVSLVFALRCDVFSSTNYMRNFSISCSSKCIFLCGTLFR